MGWLYQYFTPEQQRRDARDTKAGGSQAPRNAYELAFRNQFYTPDYVVRWLTDNTLGAVWRDSHPASAVSEACPLLLPGAGGEAPSLQQAEDLRVLDPACGSGHFLLYAFDVLSAIYQEQGVAPEAAPDAILKGNLFGVDIDWRACQIAGFALSLKARKLRREGDLPTPHVVWAQPLPAEADQRNAVLAGLSPTERKIAVKLWGAFEEAAEAGSLLRADEDLDTAMQAVRQEWQRTSGPQGVRLALPGLTHEVSFGDVRAHGYWDSVPENLRRALDAYWHRGDETGDAAELRALFAADLSSGLDLLDVLRQKYHVVLMNPPFGDATIGSRDYIAKHYPKTKHDLYTAFVERGLQWLEPGGALGALGPRTAYFLKTSTAYREEVVLTRQVAAFADLGINVLDTAKVEAAAIVVRGRAPDHNGLFFRSLKTRDKVAHLLDSTRALRAGERAPLVFEADPASLRDIPGSPFAYWVGESLRRKFKELPPLEGHAAEVRVGLQTSDDERFLRLWWEVPAAELGRGRRWVPFAKGGEYSPYWDDLRLVVDWGTDGAAIRASGNGRVQNVAYYFRPGLTFPDRAKA
ncbi:MAG TPA: DNA methyltransferase, partial [Chloroflexota bacterium]|nr:DNA methyltransferase [Chloroflexota bacterium]